MSMPSNDTPGTSPTARRPWWRWLLWTGAGLLGLALVLLIALRLLAMSGPGRSFAEAQIERVEPAGQSLSVEGLEGDLLGQFTLARLSVSDARGVWLEAEAIRAGWSPLALLSGHARIRLLSADTVRVLRRPELAAAGGSGREGSGLPVDTITLDELGIDVIALTEGVAGPQARLSLDASLSHRPDGGEFSARLVPEGEGGDRLFADLSWGGPVPLEGTVELEGPAGGLLASLARLEPGQDIRANLEAAGAPGDWSADARIRLAGEEALLVRAKGDGLDAEADGTLVLTRHPLTRPLVPRFGERIDLSCDIAPGAAGGRRIRARLSGETLDLRAAAPFEGGQPDRIELSARSEAPMRLIGTDAAQMDWLSLDGAVLFEPEGAIAFDGDLSLARLVYGETGMNRVSGPLRTRYVPDTSVQVRSELTAADVTLPAGAEPLETAKLVLDADYGFTGQRLKIAKARLDAPAIRLSASGETDIEGRGPGLRGQMVIDGPATGLVPVSVNGDWRLSREGRGLAGQFAGNVSDLPALPEPFAAWFDGWADIDFALVREDSGRLVADTLAMRSAGLQVSGQGQLSPGREVSVSLDGSADGLAGERVSSGPVDLSLTAGGTLEAPEISLDLAAPVLSLSGEKLDRPRILLESRLQDGAAPGRLRLSAGLEDEEAVIETGFRVDEAQWALDDLRIDWAGLTGSGQAAAPLARPAEASGTLKLAGLLPQIVPGERVELTADFAPERVSVSGQVSGLSAGPLDDSKAALDLDGTLDALDYRLDIVEGALTLAGIRRDFAGRFEGRVNGLTGGRPEADMSASLDIDDVRLATRRPARLALTANGPRAEIELEGFDGTARLALASRAEGLEVTGRLDALALAPMLVLAGQVPLEGGLSGEIDMTRRDGALSGGFELVASEVRRAVADAPALRLSARGEARGGILAATAAASNSEGLDLRARADIPSGWLTGAARPPFDVQIEGGGPVAALSRLVMPDETAFESRIDLDLRAPVPFDPGLLEGSVAVSEGRFEQGTLGLILEQIEARAEISQGEIRLPAFSARDPEEGRLSGQGTYRFAGGNTLSVTADALQIADRSAYSAKASGELRLEQTNAGYVVAGDFGIDRAGIDLEALPGAGLTTLDVRFPDKGETAQPVEEDEPPRVRLDIEFRAPGRIFVSGQGLDAEMSLEAAIEGPLGEPRLFGLAEIVRGRFDLAGKRFRFADSQIDLNGEVMQAGLDIEARRETESLTAIVSITGTPRRPEVSLSSQPELPEDQVLSRVLFGRSPAELSALETARLAGALAQLAGGGGTDLFGGLQEALSLDRLDFGQDASGESQVTTGKYIAENVYLEARTGPSGLPELVLEWEPLENVEVQGDITPSESQEVSIRWTRDFD